MVNHQHEDVLVPGEAEQPCAHGDLYVHVKGLGDQFGDRAGHLVLGDRENRQVQRHLVGEQHPLVGDAALVLGDQRPQALVPAQQVEQRGAQCRHVQLPVEPHHQREVVGGRRALEPVDKPQPPLRERQGYPLGALCPRQGRPSCLISGHQPDRQPCDRRCLQDGPDRDLGVQLCPDATDQPGGEQRVPAQCEEVVVDADLFDAEHLGEQLRQGLFPAGSRGPVRSAGELRLRKGPAVQLPAGRQREPVQDDDT